MARVSTIPGSNVDLDFITAGASHILTGYVGSNIEGEPVSGGIPRMNGGTYTPTTSNITIDCSNRYMNSDVVIVGDADLVVDNIRYGKNIFNKAGTFTDDGNIDAAKVLKNYVAYSRGNRIVGTMEVQSILNFNCAPTSYSAIVAQWNNPSKGPYLATRVLCKVGAYPTDSSYTKIYEGYGSSAVAGAYSAYTFTGLASSTLYYFTAQSYCVINGVRVYHSTKLQGSARTNVKPCGDCGCDNDCDCEGGCGDGYNGCNGHCPDCTGCDNFAGCPWD